MRVFIAKPGWGETLKIRQNRGLLVSDGVGQFSFCRELVCALIGNSCAPGALIPYTPLFDIRGCFFIRKACL
jgi:hypothetical protein